MNVSNKIAKNVLKNPSRALEITWNIATAAVKKSPKAVLTSLPEVINVYHTGRRLYLGMFEKLMLCKWTKKRTDYTRVHH